MAKEVIKQEFLTYVGEIIRNKRQKKNISQQEPGEYLGVRGAAVSRYENGQLDMPAAALPLISSYCGFSMSDDVRDDKIKMAVKILNFYYKNHKPNGMKDFLDKYTTAG